MTMARRRTRSGRRGAGLRIGGDAAAQCPSHRRLRIALTRLHLSLPHPLSQFAWWRVRHLPSRPVLAASASVRSPTMTLRSQPLVLLREQGLTQLRLGHALRGLVARRLPRHRCPRTTKGQALTAEGPHLHPSAQSLLTSHQAIPLQLGAIHARSQLVAAWLA